MVRMTSELETNIVAVERVKEYSETPTEVSAVVLQSFHGANKFFLRILETAYTSFVKKGKCLTGALKSDAATSRRRNPQLENRKAMWKRVGKPRIPPRHLCWRRFFTREITLVAQSANFAATKLNPLCEQPFKAQILSEKRN